MNIAIPPVKDWPYLPWALKQARIWHKKTEGRFDLLELQDVAFEAAANAQRGWKKAVAGALTDHVRDNHKVMPDPEMHEHDIVVVLKSGRKKKKLGYRSTMAELDDLLELAPSREAYRDERGVLVCPAPRRIRRRGIHPLTGKPFELPSRIATSAGYKVDSKHNKVSITLTRCKFQDGWSQQASGWKRAKITDGESGYFEKETAAEPPLREWDTRTVNLLSAVMAEPHGKHYVGPPPDEDKPKKTKPPASGDATAKAWEKRFGAVKAEGNFDLDTRRWREPEPAWPEPVGTHYTTYSTVRPIAEPEPIWGRAWSHAVGLYIEVAPKRSPTQALPNNPSPRSAAWRLALDDELPKDSSPAWYRTVRVRFQSHSRGWGLRADVHLPPGYYLEHRVVDNKAKWLWIDDGPPTAERIAAHLDRWDYAERRAAMRLPGGTTAIIGAVRDLRLKPEYL